MVFAAEVVVLIGALAIISALLARSPVQLRKGVAFVGGVMIVGGTAFGGLAWAGIPAFVEIPGVSPPTAEGLWQATFLLSSDTDRTEVGEIITDGGRTITYELTDGNMDGLGDVNLDVRVVNMNEGSPDKLWPFEVRLTFVSHTAAGGGAPGEQFIVNRTSTGTIDERYAVTYSLTESGDPTGQQIGERFISNDWKTGQSDQLNVDFETNPVATDDIAPGTPGKIQFTVGGILMTVNLLESAT